MRKIIGFFSGKGGTGKTTCAVNTGLAIHLLGEKVIVMDCDLDNANLGLHLGLYDFPTTLHDVLEKDINILETVHIHSSGLRFIPSSVAFRQAGQDLGKLKGILADLDYAVVIDGPPGIDQRVMSLMNLCDEVVVITNPNIPAVADALKIIQKAMDFGKSEISMIVTMTNGKHELRLHEIEEACKVPILGTIPTHYGFKKSLHDKTPLLLNDPHSSPAVAYKKIAATLIGKEYSPPSLLWARRLLAKF